MQDTVGCLLSAMVSLAPMKSINSAFDAAVHTFNMSWQELVERAVLGQGTAYEQLLANTSLVPDARAHFGNATLAFNWNQLHQWHDGATCSKWFLKEGGEKHVQYPVYTSALYQQSSDDRISLDVIMRGKSIDNLFDVCIRENKIFCDDDASITRNQKSRRDSECTRLRFVNLTVGQVASASSAAAGGAAVEAWVQALIELTRHATKDGMQGFINWCSNIVDFSMKYFDSTMSPSCNRDIVYQEILNVLGCPNKKGKKEDSRLTAKKWSKYLRKMAIPMTVHRSLDQYHKGHMGIDAVRPSPQI